MEGKEEGQRPGKSATIPVSWNLICVAVTSCLVQHVSMPLVLSPSLLLSFNFPPPFIFFLLRARPLLPLMTYPSPRVRSLSVQQGPTLPTPRETWHNVALHPSLPPSPHSLSLRPSDRFLPTSHLAKTTEGVCVTFCWRNSAKMTPRLCPLRTPR